MAASDPAKKSLLVSLAVGALLIPLAAFGASSLVNAQVTPPAPPTVPTLLSATTTTEANGEADLDLACGAEGMQLVTAEADGSIDEIQRAALDALRDICAAEGRSLPGPPAAAPVAPPATVATSSPPVATTADQDDDDHDDHDDDDHDDDHHRDDHGDDD
jgi:hypothetical protein